MEARVVDELPVGPQWQYEPKWDGFRCLCFRDGESVELRSKSDQPLRRHFPELADALRAIPARQFVLDGEIVVPTAGGLSFDALLLRLHPARNRVEKLARETPAALLVFDLLADAKGDDLTDRPLSERRERLDLPYASGERTAMEKIKRKRTADCVVGGFRYATILRWRPEKAPAQCRLSQVAEARREAAATSREGGRPVAPQRQRLRSIGPRTARGTHIAPPRATRARRRSGRRRAPPSG